MNSSISSPSISPLIKQGTPVKCLGLSRKRKRSGLPGTSNVINGALQCSQEKLNIEESGCSEVKVKKHSVESTESDLAFKPFDIRKTDSTGTGNLKKKKVVETQDELPKMKYTIVEENQTQSLECNSIQIHKIKKLEDLCCQWSNGCKNALLYLLKIFKKQHGENVNVKKLLQELGIYETVFTHFQNDSDLDLAAYDSDCDT